MGSRDGLRWMGERWGRLWRRIATPVGLIVCLTFLRGWLFALIVPYGMAPDEPAHFTYVMHIRNTQRLPVFYFDYIGTRLYRHVVHPPDEIDPDAASLGWAGIYSAVHGPLYYVTCSIPVAILAKRPATAAYVCRLVSVLMATATIYVFCLIGRALFPRDPPLALSIPILAAFLPQFAYIGSMVNNDNVVNLIAAILLLTWVRSLLDRITPGRAWRMGLLTGLWFLSKGSFPIAIAGCVVVFAIDLYRSRPPVRVALWQGAVYAVVAAALVLTMAIRNYVLFRSFSSYADPFVFWGAGAHYFPSFGQMVLGPPGEFTSSWAHVVFTSFWGVFDWQNLPMPSIIYEIVAWASAVGVAGTIVYVFLHRKEAEARGLIVLLFFALLNLGAFAIFCYYLIWQPQGRHLFPSLFPLMSVLAVGLSTCGVLRRVRYAILLILVAGMVWLNLYSLFTVILPHYV